MGRMAPWASEEVANINRWQAADGVHPLTCPEHSRLRLVVTADAVMCPACDYRQTWVPTALTREPLPFAGLSDDQATLGAPGKRD